MVAGDEGTAQSCAFPRAGILLAFLFFSVTSVLFSL